MSLVSYTPGNIPTYRFYITTFNPTLNIEVFPLKFLETSLVDEKEPGQVFYRRKFNGSLLFGTNSTAIDDTGATVNRRDDFDLFYFIEALDACFRIDLLITRTVGGVTEDYWTGYFSTDDGAFDLDRCTFEVSPTLDDDYSIFLDKKGIEYNMIDMLGVSEVTTEITRGTTTWSYTHNRFVFDVLEYLVDQMYPGTSLSSTFFTAANNPVTLAANRFLYLTIAQKSDIKRPTAATGATVAMVSFQSLMDMLRCLNLYWDYTPFEIRVEHISFWPATPGGIDLRTHQLAVASNKYSYTKESMPKYERFAWIESDVDFLAYDIWYDSTCVNQDPGSNSTELSVNATTDIEYIEDCMADPDLTEVIDDEGFVLLANRLDGGNYYVQIAETGGNGLYAVKFNGDLSWRSLHEFYFRHERVLDTGYLNNVLTTFYTAKKVKKQDVSVILCETFIPEEEITSELGETYFMGAKATVQKSDIQPSGLVKLNLLYGPPDTVNAGNAPTKMMQIVEECDAANTRSIFYFTLTEAADASLVGAPPQVRVVCEDAGANSCAAAYVAAVVNLGDYTFNVTVNWPGLGACVPPWVGPSVCVVQRQVNDAALPVDWDYSPIIEDNDCTC